MHSALNGLGNLCLGMCYCRFTILSRALNVCPMNTPVRTVFFKDTIVRWTQGGGDTKHQVFDIIPSCFAAAALVLRCTVLSGWAYPSKYSIMNMPKSLSTFGVTGHKALRAQAKEGDSWEVALIERHGYKGVFFIVLLRNACTTGVVLEDSLLATACCLMDPA